MHANGLHTNSRFYIGIRVLRTSKLYFQIFMDDIDTPALYFFSESKSLIKMIAKVMDDYLEQIE